MIGIDIGASWIKIVKNENKAKIATPQSKKGIELFLSQFGEEKIGVAVPGPVDLKNNKVLNTPNSKCLNNFKFAKNFVINNDAYCAALAEAKFSKYKKFIFITLGTGNGGALVINKRVFSAEIGHIITPGKNKCNCGKVGCLEKNRKYLPQVLAGLIDVFNPEAVVLGGGLVQGTRFKVQRLKKEILRNIFTPANRKVKIVVSSLDEFAGALGAWYNIKSLK